MKTFKSMIRKGYFVLAIFGVQLLILSNQASAAQNCALNSFFGTVRVDGVATDNVVVTLTDINNSSSLTGVTSSGGLYSIETANLAICASVGDQIKVSATVINSGSSTVTYASQALTNVDISISTLDTTPPGISFSSIASQFNQSAVPSNVALTITDNVGTTTVTFSESGTTNSGALTGSGNIYNLQLSNTLGFHEYIITASDSALNTTSTSLSYTVVSDMALTAINVTPTNPTINSGATVQLTATALDQSGGVIAPTPTITWTSSNTGAVIVNGSGLVTGVTTGTGMITATSSGITGTTTVTVTSGTGGADTTSPIITFTGITNNSTITQSNVPTSVQLNITDNVGVTSSTFSESGTTNSGTLIGGLSSFDISHAIGTHVYVFTAMDLAGNTTSLTITYTVTSGTGTGTGTLTTINVTPTNPTINSGATVQLTATALDQSGAVITPTPTITWTSSNTGAVIVNGSGLVTGISAGTGMITATSSGISGTTTVTVTSGTGGGDTTPPVITFTGITNNSTITQSNVPTSVQLNITDNIGIVSLVTFHNESSSGTLVSPSGIYTLNISNELGMHEYVVTARDGAGNTGSITITYTVIGEFGLSAINITPTNPTINSGATVQLTATALDQSGAVITPTPTITWTSSNVGVVIVNGSGLITGISAGTGMISATSSGVTGTTIVTVTSSTGGSDSTPPVITFTQITSPIKQKDVPASIQLTIFDNVGIVSMVSYSESGTTNSGTLLSPFGIYTLNISNAIGTHKYVVTAMDGDGNVTSVTISYTVITDIDVTAPIITFTPIADQFNQSAVPPFMLLTITDDVGVTSVTFSESGTTNSGTLTGSGNIYKLLLSNSLGHHKYIVTAKDLAGNTSNATISYKVVSDSVLNMNILGFNLENLTSTGLLITWTTDKIASESLVDFYADETQLLNQVATINGKINSLIVNNLTPNRVYSVVIKSKTAGQENFTTLTIVIKTALSNSGLIVSKIESISPENPTVGGDFGSGYHFRFYVTAHDFSENGITLKLADWANGASTLSISGNTLMSVSEDGFNNFNSANGSTIAVTNNYGAFQNISSIDSDANLGGRQCIIDLFYKIPAGAGGVYGAAYGLKTQ